MIRLFLLYAILIFAKKAPKLIADLLKLDNKDGVGLKGLNIKNKMGEAALVGDKVKKGMMGAQGYLDATGGFLYRKGMEKLKNLLSNSGNKAKEKGKSSLKNLKQNGLKGVIADKKGDIKSYFSKDARNARKQELQDKKADLKNKAADAKNNVVDRMNGVKGKFNDLKNNIKNDGLIKVAAEKLPHLKVKLQKNLDEFKTKGLGKTLGELHAVGMQGFGKYYNAEDTKGAFNHGQSIADPTYKTVTERLESRLNTYVSNLSEEYLPSEKDIANIQLRNKIGLDISADDVNMNDIFEKYSSFFDKKKVMINGVEKYKISDKDWKSFQKTSEYTSLTPEGRLILDDMYENMKISDLTDVSNANQQITSFNNQIVSMENAVAQRKIAIQNTLTSAGQALQNISLQYDQLDREYSIAEQNYNNLVSSGVDDSQIESAKNILESKRIQRENAIEQLNKARGEYNSTKEECDQKIKEIDEELINDSQYNSLKANRDYLIAEKDFTMSIGYEMKDSITGEPVKIKETDIYAGIESAKKKNKKTVDKLNKEREKNKPSSDDKK